MSLLAAATLDDEIKHSGLLANILKVATTVGTGLLVGIAIGVAAVAVVGTGGLGALVLGALVGAVVGAAADGVAQSITGKGLQDSLVEPIHAAIDKALPGSVKGNIVTGSPNVRINSKAAARAQADDVQCSDHPPAPRPRIAQGSGNVFINSHPAARAGDKTECGAVLSVHPSRRGNVSIGGGQTTVLNISDGLPPWLAFVSKYIGFAMAVCQAWRGDGKAWQKIICFGGNMLMGMAADKLVSSSGLSQGVANGIAKALNGLTGNPVHLPTGTKVLNGEDDTDFEIPATLPLAWVRRYNALHTHNSGLLGPGWSTLYDMELRINDATPTPLPWGPRPPDTPHTLLDPSARAIPIPRLTEQQKFTLPQEGMTLACLEGGPQGRYVLQFADGWVVDFGSPSAHPGPQTLRPLLVQDANENAHHLGYDSQARLHTLRTTCGQELTLHYTHQRHPRRVSRVDYCNANTYAGKPCPVQTLVHYAYDAQGQLTQVRNAAGEETRRFSYDAHKRMDFQMLPEGLEVQYVWDAQRVIGWRTSRGERVSIQYELGTEISSATITTYLEDQTAASNPSPPTSQTWHWDAQHRITQYRDALGHAWHLQWEADKRQLQSITSPTQARVQLAYDERGNLSTLTDPLGRSTQTLWHAELAVPLQVTHPDQSYTHYQYDALGNLCVQTFFGPAPPQDPTAKPPAKPRPLATERWAHDAQGRVIAHTDAQGGTRLFAYSRRGLLLRQTDCSQRSTRYGYHPHSPWGALHNVTWADGTKEHYTHDTLGRPLTHTRPDASTLRWQWNARGQLSASADALGHISRYQYNALGLPIAHTDPQGQVTRQRYDAQGKCLELVDAAAQSTRFAYNAAGQLVAQYAMDAISTHYTLDALGLPTGVETRSADGTMQQRIGLVRDATGRLLEKHTADTRTLYHYDVRDQLVKIERFEWLHGVLPHVGNASQAQRPMDTLEFAYDALGNLTEEHSTAFEYPATEPGDYADPSTATTPTNQRSTVIRHTHDALGNTTQTVLPQGPALNYLYYGSGHLHQVNLDGHTISDIERNALHQETLRSQGHLHTLRRRDALGRVVQQVSRLGVQGMQDFADLAYCDIWHQAGQRRTIKMRPIHMIKAYALDANAQLVQRRDPLAGEVQYQYDALGRVHKSRSMPALRQDKYVYETWSDEEVKAAFDRTLAPHTPAHEGLSEAFAWDAASNPVPPGVVLNAQTSTGYVKHNRVLVHEDKRYQYDGLGRLIEKRIGSHTVQLLRWNGESQLCEVETVRHGVRQRVRFGYDALGRRVVKSGSFGTVFFVWSGMRLLQELQGAKVTTHVYEDQDSYVPLARVESMDVGRLKEVGLDYDYEQNPQYFKPRVYYVHANSAGAPEELTDAQGRVVWQARYQTWGNVALQPDTGPDPHGFALPQFKPEGQCLRLQGQYADSETGLHYNTFRFYDPDVGRFISQDPIGLAGGLNLYQYAPNPLSWIDPWGWVAENTPGYNVYGLYEKGAASPYYIGITDDLARRRTEHIQSSRLDSMTELRPLDRNITYGQARGYEQAYIEKYKTKTGVIGTPISPNNRGNKVSSFDRNNSTRPQSRQKYFENSFNAKNKSFKGSC